MALIMALVLAILYFALIELLMIDAARELTEARRFRARIVALTLAENGAELAARQLVTTESMSADVNASDWQGAIVGKMVKNFSGEFEIIGRGQSKGTEPTTARVHLQGRIVGTMVRIQYARHTQ